MSDAEVVIRCHQEMGVLVRLGDRRDSGEDTAKFTVWVQGNGMPGLHRGVEADKDLMAFCGAAAGERMGAFAADVRAFVRPVGSSA